MQKTDQMPQIAASDTGLSEEQIRRLFDDN